MSDSTSSSQVLQNPLSHSKLYATHHSLVVQHSHTNKSAKSSKDSWIKAGSCLVNARSCGERGKTREERSACTHHRSSSRTQHHSAAPSSNSVVNRASAKNGKTSSKTVRKCGSKDDASDERTTISSDGIRPSHVHSQYPTAGLALMCSLPPVEANSPHIAKKTTTCKRSTSNSYNSFGRGSESTTGSKPVTGESRGRVGGAWMTKSTRTVFGQSCKVSSEKYSETRSHMEAGLLSGTESVSTIHLPPAPHCTNRRLPSGRQTSFNVSRCSTPTTYSQNISHSLKIPRRSSSTAASSVGWSQGRQLQLGDIAAGLGRMKYRSIIVMSGAGISTASGIPDFRTPGTGLYDNLQKYNLPEPSAVFDVAYFHHNPRPFFTLAKELYPGKSSPNLVHCFVRLLQDKGLLLRNYTQNIDGLERLAGVQGGKLVEAHGSFSTASCTRCHSKQDPLEVKRAIFNDQIPKCRHKYCNGVVKPDIVFFGEDLPQRFHSLQLPDFSKCDLLLVMGTSLEVEPFASLVTLSRHTVPRLLLNRELVGPFRSVRCRRTDVAADGDIVESVKVLVEGAGWGAELEEIQRRVCKVVPQQAAACSQPAGSDSASVQLVPALQRLTIQQETHSHRPQPPESVSSDPSSTSVSSTSSSSSSSSSD